MPEDYLEQSRQPDKNFDSLSGHFIALKTGQKIAVAVLAVFSVAVFFSWTIRLKQSIYSPIERQAASRPSSAGAGLANGCAGDDCVQSEALKAKDTDNDGLSDYDELYIHKTSPYLPDTDSDGFSDKDEIDSGNNPNCPSGAVCGQAPAGDGAGPLLQAPAGQEELDPADSAVLESIFLGASDAATLRALLVQSGMDASLLGQISDQDLMRYYQETLDSLEGLETEAAETEADSPAAGG